MRRRHPQTLPRLWLVTDERQGAALIPAVRALPRGSGVVFRHYSLKPAARARLFATVRRIARARRLTLVLAGRARDAAAWRADGVHGDARLVARPLIRSAAAHGARELVAARRAHADLVFVSPVAPTRSHPGARTLGRIGLSALIRHAAVPVVALGGLKRRPRVPELHGWAAIDALTPDAR